MSVTDVARISGLNKSTVSRIVKSNPDLVKGKKGRSKLITLTGFNLIRQNDVNPSMAGNHAGKMAGEEELPLPNVSPDDPSLDDDYSGMDNTVVSGLNEARTRSLLVKAERDEMALMKEKGELLLVSDVKEVVQTSFRMVKEELLSAAKMTCVDLAAMSDPKDVKTFRINEVNEILARLSEKITKVMD